MLTIQLKGTKIKEGNEDSQKEMDTFDRLKEWFETKGGYLASGVHQRETEYGAGLCASVDHAEG